MRVLMWILVAVAALAAAIDYGTHQIMYAIYGDYWSVVATCARGENPLAGCEWGYRGMILRSVWIITSVTLATIGARIAIKRGKK